MAPRSSEQNHVGEIEIELAQPLATDPYTVDPNTGRLVLEFDGRIAGGGLVLSVQPADTGITASRVATAEAAAAAVTHRSDSMPRS